MNINRLYTFTPGEVIQSSQVNAELDQIVNTINAYALNGNYTSNNFIADGDVISAISTLDEFLASGGVVGRNSSQNAIIKLQNTDARIIGLAATTERPIVFSCEGSVFYETENVELTLSADNGFSDIYIEEDTSKTPTITGTKRIKVVAKASGTCPYTTCSITGQYLIGSTSVYSNRIRGIHSLEVPNTPTYHSATWGDGNAFDHTLSTTFSFSTKKAYVPVFVNSTIFYNVKTYYKTNGSGLSWNFDFYIRRNGSTDHYSRERIHPLSPSDLEGRTNRMTADRAYEISPGLYTFEYGGKMNTEDDPRCTITIFWLYAHFQVYPSHISFKAQ